MDTKLVKPAGRRTRRRHDPEFKAQVIEACLQPGVSIAAVALANGLNANFVRQWVRAHREHSQAGPTETTGGEAVKSAGLVPVKIERPLSGSGSGEIRLEIRRGATTVQLGWPSRDAAALTRCLNDLLG
jgi:transposase